MIDEESAQVIYEGKVVGFTSDFLSKLRQNGCKTKGYDSICHVVEDICVDCRNICGNTYNIDVLGQTMSEFRRSPYENYPWFLPKN